MPLPRSILAPGTLGDLDLRLVAGVWPDDIAGEVFISTSDVATAGRHAFFGDGWMIRLSLQPGSHGAPADAFAWRARLLDTPSRRLREACPDAFTTRAYGTSSPFGFSNAANTAPLPWGDRLFATWDVGRPVELDPVTLEVLGEVGQKDSWGPDPFGHPVLPMVSSTAHPAVDPERGCLWTVRSNPMTGELAVLRWDGAGTEMRRWPLEGVTLPQSMHTVGQTRDWLVLVDCAFRADPNEVLGLGERSVTTFVDEPVFLIRKDELEATPSGQPVTPRAVLRVGPETNHYYGAWDDADGIRLVLEHTIDTDLAMALRADDVDAWGRPVDPALVGMYVHPMHQGAVTEVLIDPDRGTVTVESRFEDPTRAWAVQLSALDWSVEAQAAPTVHHQLFTGFRPDAICQRALDLYAERVDRDALPAEEIPAHLVTLTRGGLTPKGSHTFAPDDYATSPCFVPRNPGATPGRSRYAPADPGGTDGWIVVPVLHDDGFRVELFDAGDVSRGPIATLAAPGGATVPFLIHSAWMPRAVPSDPTIERLRFADDLDEQAVATLPDELADAVWRVATA